MMERGLRRPGLKLMAAAWLLMLVVGCDRNPAELGAEHRLRAEAYLRQGKYREASVEFQSALQQVPDDADSLYGMARSLDALGQPAEYRDILAKVLRVEPSHGPSCVELGGLLWAAGNFTEALELAERVEEGSPLFFSALRVKARALAALQRMGEARKVWAQVLRSEGPSSETVYLEAGQVEAWTGNLEGAQNILTDGLLLFPNSEPLSLAMVGLLLGEAKYADAETMLADLEAQKGVSAKTALARARLLIRTQGVVAALEYLAQTQAGLDEEDSGELVELVLQRARLLVELGMTGEALEVLQTARNDRPQAPEIATVLADVLISEGRTKEVQDLLPKAWEYDPTGRIARLFQARIYLQEGRSYWALLTLEELVAKGDLTVETRFLYARALATEQRWPQARREYLKILRRLPDHYAARMELSSLLRVQGDLDGALQQLEALPEHMNFRPAIRLRRAQLLLARGDLGEAQSLADGLLHEAGDNPVVLKLCGDVASARGRFNLAIRYYERALDQDPDAIEVLFAKARVQQERGSPVGEVIQILEDFQRSRKEDPRILHKIALLWVGEGNLLAAKRTVERSLLIEPNYWPSRTLLARILLEGGDESRARVELEEAINLNPFHPEAYLELGAILRRRGDFAAAEATFLQLLARNPEEANVANNLADLYLAQRKVTEGLQWARVAYAGAPKEPAVLDTLGWALHLSGQLEEAAQLLERANEGYPDEPEVRLHWGVNLAARGDRTRAQQVLGWVVKSAPDSDAAARAREVLAMLPQPGSASAD